jgi:DNA-binding NarL/FixJ family response regulator
MSKSKHRIGWKKQVAVRENVKSTQLTEAKLPPSRSVQSIDVAADCGSDLARDDIPPERLGPAVSAAEQRVLSLVSRGRTNKEIAAALGLSPATIKRHIEKILTKLGLRNRVELAIHGVMANNCPHYSTLGCALRRFERDDAISR